MDFTGGQVLNIKNLSEHIKGLKTNKEKRIKKQELTEQLKKTQEEIKILNTAFDNIADTEAIESSIYRLKAAELDLNRQVRTLKSLPEYK